MRGGDGIPRPPRPARLIVVLDYRFDAKNVEKALTILLIILITSHHIVSNDGPPCGPALATVLTSATGYQDGACMAASSAASVYNVAVIEPRYARHFEASFVRGFACVCVRGRL